MYPSAGENYVFNQKMPSLALMERIGYMAQSDALYGELSAKENLQFFSSLYGLKGKQQNARIKEVMEIVNLHEDLNKLVYQLFRRNEAPALTCSSFTS